MSASDKEDRIGASQRPATKAAHLPSPVFTRTVSAPMNVDLVVIDGQGRHCGTPKSHKLRTKIIHTDWLPTRRVSHQGMGIADMLWRRRGAHPRQGLSVCGGWGVGGRRSVRGVWKNTLFNPGKFPDVPENLQHDDINTKNICAWVHHSRLHHREPFDLTCFPRE